MPVTPFPNNKRSLSRLSLKHHRYSDSTLPSSSGLSVPDSTVRLRRIATPFQPVSRPNLPVSASSASESISRPLLRTSDRRMDRTHRHDVSDLVIDISTTGSVAVAHYTPRCDVDDAAIFIDAVASVTAAQHMLPIRDFFCRASRSIQNKSNNFNARSDEQAVSANDDHSLDADDFKCYSATRPMRRFTSSGMN